MSEDLALAPEPLRLFLATFNLNGFNAGRHIVRDQRGWRVRDIQVQSLWLATIKPSFDPTAYFMVINTDADPQAIFCLQGADALPNIQGEPLDCSGLDDKLSASLKHIDLCPRGGGISLDGIGYSLHVRNLAIDSDLEFSNPRTESLVAVQRALFATAESVSRISGSPVVADYLEVWRKYLR